MFLLSINPFMAVMKTTKAKESGLTGNIVVAEPPFPLEGPAVDDNVEVINKVVECNLALEEFLHLLGCQLHNNARLWCQCAAVRVIQGWSTLGMTTATAR